jgi:uncharacterized protein
MRPGFAFVAGGVLIGGALFAVTVAQTFSVPSALAQDSTNTTAEPDQSADRSLRDLTKILRSTDQPDAVPGAISDLEAMVEAGDAEAALLLGTEYAKDRGALPVDYAKATSFLEQAAAMGMPDVYMTLANLHRREVGGLSQSKTLTYLKQAADAGVDKARMALADAYRKGTYGEPDIPAAITYYQAALDAGEADAADRLVAVYRSGTGGPDDDAMMVKYLTIMADGGDVSAMRTLANTYFRGQSVPKDIELAEKYLRSAITAGDDSARSDLGQSLLRGQYGEDREAEGVALLQTSYEAGDVGVASDLANAYLRGRGAERDIPKALAILKSGEENGDQDARNALLDLYLRGVGRDLAPNLSAAHAVYQAIPEDQRIGNVAASGAVLAAYGKTADDYAAMWALFKDLDPRLQARTGTQILRINDNSYVYMLQGLMTQQGQYSGDMTGMLTSSTISAVNQLCADHDITVECRFGPLARTTWQAISTGVLAD